LGHTEV
jgi:hypothetical protein